MKSNKNNQLKQNKMQGKNPDYLFWEKLKQKDLLAVTSESSACTAGLESSLAVSQYSIRYFLQLNRIWRSSTATQELETLLGFFEKSSALGIYLDLTTQSTAYAAFIYNEKDPSVLSSLGYDYRVTDQFKIKLTANILTSSSQNALAQAYDKTDNLGIALGYDF